MRKIKFRCWDIVNKKMRSDKDLWDITYNEIFIHTPDQRALNIMQYTGLKDINGTEIYEGDIVEYVNKGTKGIGKIVYGLYDNEHQTDLGYYIQWLNQEYWRNDLGYWKKKGIEVRGNIYENPTLLEEER